MINKDYDTVFNWKTMKLEVFVTRKSIKLLIDDLKNIRLAEGSRYKLEIPIYSSLPHIEQITKEA